MDRAKRTLQIEICKAGFRPFELDKEEKQRLTIHDNGKVWFTTYGLKTELHWEYKSIRKLRCKIGEEQAGAIIDKAVSIINALEITDALYVMECDTVPDRITVVEVSGQYKTKSIYNESVPAVQDFYDEIRKVIPFNRLLEFDYEFYSE